MTKSKEQPPFDLNQVSADKREAVELGVWIAVYSMDWTDRSFDPTLAAESAVHAVAEANEAIDRMRAALATQAPPKKARGRR